jgi:hypothetical protein
MIIQKRDGLARGQDGGVYGMGGPPMVAGKFVCMLDGVGVVMGLELKMKLGAESCPTP